MNAAVLSLLDLRAFTGDLATVLAAPDDPTGPQDAVHAIIADVRSRGDVAVRELTARFDGCTIDASSSSPSTGRAATCPAAGPPTPARCS